LSQPSDYCTAWDKDVNHNPASKVEADEFQHGREMQAVLKSVSRRLGYDADIAYGMYALFGYVRN
jgi:hypothetical protein